MADQRVNNTDNGLTVPIRDYIDLQRSVDLLSFENGHLKREMEEIRSIDNAKIRAEIMDIKSAAYDLYQRLEGVLKLDPTKT